MGLLRMLFALSVALTHSGIRPPVNATLAVRFFFTISGFYMAMVLDGKYAPTAEGIKKFYGNRLLRLLPSYYISLLVAIAVIVAVGSSQGNFYSGFWQGMQELGASAKAAVVAAQAFVFGQDALLFTVVKDGGLVYTSNFGAAPRDQQTWVHTLNPPAWSLSIELLFYCFVPFLARLKTRTLFIGMLVTLAIRLACAKVVPIMQDPWDYRFFPFEISTFMAGMVGYRIYRHGGWKQYVPENFRKFAPWALAILCLVLQKAPFSSLWLPYLFIALLPTMFEACKKVVWDRKIGDFSYPVYIIHWPIVQLFKHLGFAHANWAGVIVVVAVSVVLFNFVELPIDRLRQRLV